MGSQTNGRLEDYFSSKVESLRKDVECVFGILKGRWASLDKGFKYRDVKTCGQIFLTCEPFDYRQNVAVVGATLSDHEP